VKAIDYSFVINTPTDALHLEITEGIECPWQVTEKEVAEPPALMYMAQLPRQGDNITA